MTITTMVLAALAGIFQVALVFLVKRVKLPALTISFNLVTIFFLASVNANKTVAATLRDGGPAPAPIEGEPNFVLAHDKKRTTLAELIAFFIGQLGNGNYSSFCPRTAVISRSM